MTVDVIAAARRRTRRFAVAVLVGAALTAACVYPAGLYVNAHLDDGAWATPAPATPGPAADEAPPDAWALPADARWIDVAGVKLPVSSATGPAQTVAGLARGFAHTPAGAVVAALHLLVRTTA